MQRGDGWLLRAAPSTEQWRTGGGRKDPVAAQGEFGELQQRFSCERQMEREKNNTAKNTLLGILATGQSDWQRIYIM
ncbi:hypothetical protein NDU88_006142 [Pleurodeles waltl]|uniref:Uncharacterized protein n=1 Tax=Pleurodeles waltl TaxID=8319 RepID=A0AAV7TD40_PLEWA|nr:hypothetical protein NDU88_006142 [Pleurodeles waltl]